MKMSMWNIGHAPIEFLESSYHHGGYKELFCHYKIYSPPPTMPVLFENYTYV